MTNLRLGFAVLLLTAAAGAFAQAAPKPVSRADYLKTLDTRFNTVDANHDGSLSKAEIAAQQQRDLERASAGLTTTIQTRFKQLDTNKDGQLSLREFMALTPPIRSTETADQVMATMDLNHDGKVDAEEFRAPRLAHFNKADANHDGIVTPAEERAAGPK